MLPADVKRYITVESLLDVGLWRSAAYTGPAPVYRPRQNSPMGNADNGRPGFRMNSLASKQQVRQNDGYTGRPNHGNPRWNEVTDPHPSERSLWDGLLGDGRPALATVGVGLAFAGGLAVYLGMTRQLLPHDLAYLGLTAGEIDQIADGRLMDFMVHDRVSWGGSLIAVGVIYLWLTAFPLSQGRRWAWLTFAATGVLGFVSFASHLPTGYLDSWHGLGTLLLVPVFAVGLHRSRRIVETESTSLTHRLSALTWGRRIVIAVGAGLAVSALVIGAIGMTVTFVPSDLDFIRLTADQLQSIDSRLVPLVAHDRVGFAGGVFISGLLIATTGLFGEGRAARQSVTISGLAGFGLALGIHLAVGYTDLLHLAPAIIGPAALLAGLILWTHEDKGTELQEQTQTAEIT